jgi:short-chain fatty acids transporter
MRSITNFCIKLVKNYLPNSYALAIVLTLVVFIWGVAVTDTSVLKMVEIWNGGLYANLTFILQMCLLMLYGQTLGIAPFVGRMIKRVSRIPKGRVQAVSMTFFIAYFATFLNWGLGLAIAAMVARDVAIENKGSKLDFGMLVAAAYIGCQLPGLSSAIPLIVATDGHFLQEVIGIVPMSQTMFAGWNIIAMIVTLLAIAVTLVVMIPKPENSKEADVTLFAEEESVSVEGTPHTVAERLEASVALQLLVCAIGVAALVIFYGREGLGMSINTVNLTFMILGMIFHRTPRNYLKAISISIKSTAGIVFLFPLYFGIMAMMRNSGLAAIITTSIVSFSSASTLPVFTFLSAGLVNLFVPSGGGQWAVQGPLVVDAAKVLGADMGRVIMGVCWGDLWTNLIQPFWAIPVLAIAKLDVKDVMGYCTAVSLVFGVSVAACMLIL